MVTPRTQEDERIAAILERIQAMKPEYKQRYEVITWGQSGLFIIIPVILGHLNTTFLLILLYI